ncbi:MAG: SUMF1/EgtB/PvdO family nonheme iron enzyme [Nannocystis sp.]|uniref:formylglycine-generating enzyme family protein n=1 Tax=Nannocystis sp. TaxID=1962667 RepID=UPI00242445E2|nr:SUMF1/EgtB/PvdO family nonheme iron enzyme [Nannocystis sp.]MBK9757452.1 SUMF1/EgtB/PvdO family nonheme iron enzyme [Nannocystis sp.]
MLEGAVRPAAIACACLCLACAREPAPRPVHVQAPPAASPSLALAELTPGPAPVAPIAATSVPASPPASPAAVEPALPVAPDGTRALPCRTPPAGLACVPGGPFLRGSDDGPENTHPRATVWLQTFYMDTHEVTHAEYKACEARGACAPAGPRYNDYDRPRQPIVGVSWHDAVAYCAAHGKHLPSEAQWEKAARGPDGALYPWGDEKASCARAVIKEKRRRSCGVAKLGERPDKGRTFEVGARPAGVYGLYDMSGNAWEWVADWASESYARCGAACEGVDPLGPCGGASPCKRHHERVVRGGSWYWEAEYATAIYRRTHVPSNRPYHHYGFRCAASDAELAALSAGA